jgi:hypothetical protein
LIEGANIQQGYYLDLQKKSDFLLFSMSREALKSYPLKSNPDEAINLTKEWN